MEEHIKDQILQLIDFTIGTMPMKYLSLPLSSKKWCKMDCQGLVDQNTHRITSDYSRTLSYARRLQVINVVLFSIYNIWGAVLIL